MPAGYGEPLHAALRWRLILDPGASSHLATACGALNMAVDAALLESVQRGGPPAVRFYLWDPACLSFGRNQHARGVYDPGRAAAAGIDLVRRPTGGLAVLHDRELTYSVLAPLRLFGGPRAAYRAINRALVEGLRLFGVAAGQATGARARDPVHAAADPCFQAPAAGEVMVEGRKLVGSAQRCERGSFLQHGSILMSGSQTRVLDLLAQPPAAAPGPDGSIALGDLLASDPSPDDLATAIRRGFERVFGTRLAPDTLSDDEKGRAQHLAAQFGSAEWTWRR